jgi:hypothetical protein
MEIPSLAALRNYYITGSFIEQLEAALEDTARNAMTGLIWGLSSVAGTLSMTTAP